MGYEQQIYEQAAALGGEVAEALDPARAWQQRADQLNEALKTARTAEEKTYAAQIETAVSTGKLPPPNGVGYWAHDSVGSRQVVAAVAVCHTKATAAAREATPGLFRAMQRRIKAVVDESAKRAATLPPGVVDESTALRAGKGGTEHYTTWTRLRTLVDTWTQAFELLAIMQRAGWLDGPTHPRDTEDALIFQSYLRPLALPPGYWRGPGELRLAKAAASNAKPGMYPWQDAVQRWEMIDRRQREYRVFSARQRHDSLGNVVWEEKGAEQPMDQVPIPVGSQPIVPMVG